MLMQWTLRTTAKNIPTTMNKSKTLLSIMLVKILVEEEMLSHILIN